MNASAKAHLAKAKEYVDRGEQFYRMAAEQIIAAQQADATLANREIGAWFDRSATWVRDIVRWHTSAQDTASLPYSGKPSEERYERAAKQVLRGADEGTLTGIVDALTPTQAAKLAAAADAKVQAHGREQRRQSETKYREAVTPGVVDDLDEQQQIHHAEAELFKARRALRDAVALLSEADVLAMRNSWREDLLKTIEDLAGRVGMCRVLLEGGTVNDDELTALLQEGV